MKIHILGASGSGTTTFAKALSQKLNITHYDTDDYFWIPTDPPYEIKRPLEERYELLDQDLSHDSWILSGSMCGWGDRYIHLFDYVIFLNLPHEIRMGRLLLREKERYGSLIEPGKPLYKAHLTFIEWAKKYDTGGLEIRSYNLHRHWLKNIPGQIITIDGEYELEERLNLVLKEINYG